LTLRHRFLRNTNKLEGGVDMRKYVLVKKVDEEIKDIEKVERGITIGKVKTVGDDEVVIVLTGDAKKDSRNLGIRLAKVASSVANYIKRLEAQRGYKPDWASMKRRKAEARKNGENTLYIEEDSGWVGVTVTHKGRIIGSPVTLTEEGRSGGRFGIIAMNMYAFKGNIMSTSVEHGPYRSYAEVAENICDYLYFSGELRSVELKVSMVGKVRSRAYTREIEANGLVGDIVEK